MTTLGPPKGIDIRVAVLRVSRRVREVRSVRLSKLTDNHMQRNKGLREGKAFRRPTRSFAKGKFMNNLYTIRKESKLFP